jgi:hypothetical protein
MRYIFMLNFLSFLLIFPCNIVAQDNDTREILRLGRGTANSLDWRPDGKVLAVGSGTGIWLYDEKFETLGHWDNDGVVINKVRWSPDGIYLITDTTGPNYTEDILQV